MTVRAFVGIGSNLDAPRRQVERAFDALANIPHTRLAARSSLYSSAPLGPGDQPDYINAVAALETALAAEALLESLQAIEREHGRTRERHWGPRTLDLDLLLYGEETISTPQLTVPHPGLPERAFVLYPLAELAAALVVPGLGTVAALAARLPADHIHRLDDTDTESS